MKTPPDYSKLQEQLVYDCERIHEEGLRHKSLSGSLIEDLLIKKLSEVVRGFNFARGIIKFKNSKGHDLTANDLSPQIDIIIFKGEPVFKKFNNVVVNREQVRGVMEIKKWAYPKMLKPKGPEARKLKELEEKGIPTFFIAFRSQDRQKPKKYWYNLIRGFPAKSFCFFGTYSRNNKKNFYPWDEKEGRWKPYKNQFRDLVKEIKKLQ